MTEEIVESTEATPTSTSLAFDPQSLPEDLSNEPSLRNFDREDYGYNLQG